MLNIYLWNELVVIPFITPEIVAANRSAWVTLFGGNSLGWVKPTESSDGIDLLDQSTGFNYSFLFPGGTQVQRGEMLFYWPTKNWILRFGRNAKQSSLPVLILRISVKSSCVSSYVSLPLNSGWNYAQLPFPKGFSPLKDLGTFIIVPYKIPWLMWPILCSARLLAWAFLFTFCMAHRLLFFLKNTG